MDTNTRTFVTDVLKGMNAVTNQGGRFFIDGNMVNVALSRTIAEALYIGEIFKDGQSITGKYTTDRSAAGGMIRVYLDTAYKFTSRTLSYGARKGTEGNGGILNTQSPLMPASEEINIYMNQVNDQSLLFPDLSKEYLPLDIVTTKISSFAKSVSQEKNASILADIIAYNVWRALNSGENIISGFDGTQDNAYGKMIAQANTILDNGDRITNVFSYATDGRTIIGRPAFINGIFSKNSGVILNGSDLAQTMLRDYDLSARASERTYVGQNYKGYFGNFHFVIAPDYLFTLAEMYLGLTPGTLDKLDAIAVSYEATAAGTIVDNNVKIVDATNGKRGVEVQPLNVWGVEAFRKTVLIGKSGFDTTFLAGNGFSANERKNPTAPNMSNPANATQAAAQNDKILKPVLGEDGSVKYFVEVAQVNQANGGNFPNNCAEVQADPAGGDFSGTKSVTLTTATKGADIYYTTDGTIPTTASSKYSAAVELSATTTLAAIAVKKGLGPSRVNVWNFKKTD